MNSRPLLLTLTLALTLAAGWPPATAAELTPEAGHQLIRDLMNLDPGTRQRAAERLIASGDATWLPSVVDALFFTPKGVRAEISQVLEKLSGEPAKESYLQWVEVVGRRSDLKPKEGYADFKRSLFERIDPRFGKVLYRGAPALIRLEEIVFGGVRLDGIPSLDNQPAIRAKDAKFLAEDDVVFAASVGGEHRAYAEKALSWHEMANDVLGGEPVTLSFCTLCGTAVMYSGKTPSGPRTFGTSGLLYRSNKLMYDRDTFTLWNQLTGEPVVGKLVGSGTRLERIPLTRTTWGAWRRLHPDTTAMLVNPELGKPYGFDYRPGAADRARKGVQFPVWQASQRLPRNEEVYALALGATAKAYQLEPLLAAGVVLDQLGATALVLVADRASGSVRAYQRGEHSFRAGARPLELVDGEGRTWKVTEGALEPTTPGQSALPRLPGQVAFWFGWFGFYPQTEVWPPAN